jgi:histidinol-phosphate/aromatic aminotransferase/cobyric acid decarboxylase-like protein
MDFVEESRELSLIRADIPENLIVIKSLTKFFAIPGLRLGMAYARPGVAEMLNMTGLPWSVNALAQKAAETLYQAEDYIRASRTKCRSLRDYLAVRIDALPGWSAVPSTANFILARLPGELSASRLQEDLIKKGILIRSCADFQGLGEQYIRLAVRPKRETDELLDAITRISHRIPVASADSTTVRARIGKTPDCSMSIRLLRRFTNLHPRSSTLRPLPPHGGQAATKSCEICRLNSLRLVAAANSARE